MMKIFLFLMILSAIFALYQIFKKQGLINSYTLEINSLKDTLQSLKEEEDSLLKELAEESKKLFEKENEDLIQYRDSLEKIIDNCESQIDVEDFYITYDYEFEHEFSETYKQDVSKINQLQNEMTKDDTAFTVWSEDDKNLKKLVIRAFNVECQNTLRNISVKNYQQSMNKISKSFETINRLSPSVQISEEYLETKFHELKVLYTMKHKEQIENEIRKQELEKKREDALLKKEVFEKQSLINKEKLHYINALDKLKEKEILIEDSSELLTLQKKIAELESQIEVLEDESKDLEERLLNTGAGYVYIISNIGSFGRDVYKIGVTRRLNPYDRINELSSASVPFKFDIHAIIYSKNAFELENALHKRFQNFRKNKVNNRKEFFTLTQDQLQSTLSEYKELTFDYVAEPEAFEYYQSRKIEHEIL